jgi:hypothetical protein
MLENKRHIIFIGGPLHLTERFIVKSDLMSFSDEDYVELAQDDACYTREICVGDYEIWMLTKWRS